MWELICFNQISCFKFPRFRTFTWLAIFDSDESFEARDSGVQNFAHPIPGQGKSPLWKIFHNGKWANPATLRRENLG
jgi:hypothetical protein